MLTLYLSVLDTNEKKSKFELIYENYNKLVIYLALKEFNDIDTAEDIAGDVFEAIARNIDCITDAVCDKTKSFICTVTKSKICDKKNKEKKFVQLDESIITPIEKSNAFETVYLKDVINCLEQLPEQYKNILILKVYHGLSAEQIAKICKISKETVRKRVERARKMLTKSLERGDCNVRTK